MIVDLLGHIGAVLLAFSSAPQLITTIRKKDVTGLSLITLLLWGFGCAFMGTYVLFTTQQPPLLFNYGFNTTLVGANIILYLKYKK